MGDLPLAYIDRIFHRLFQFRLEDMIDFHMVSLGNAVFRAGEAGIENTVVGQKKKSGRVIVEPADHTDAFSIVLRNQVHDGRIAFILHGAHIAFRLVHHQSDIRLVLYLHAVHDNDAVAIDGHSKIIDCLSVHLKAAPKESILAGTTNFCGFGNSVDYWTGDYFINSKAACKAVKDNLHYALYALANSNALNGINSSSRRIELMTSWRILYITLITVFSVTTVAGIAAYTVTLVLNKKKESN